MENDSKYEIPSFLLENSLPDEIWKRTIQSEKYFVSNMGRVYGIVRKKFLKGLLSHGYHRVALCGNPISIHRLVAINFIPNPDNKPEVNHLGTKTDNRASMLQWTTNIENNQHSAKYKVKHKTVAVKQIDPKTKKVVRIYDRLVDINLEKKYDFRNVWKILDTGKLYRHFLWERLVRLNPEPDTLPGEIWVNLKDSIYPEVKEYTKYQVSNLGRVKGHFGKILKLNNNGRYLTVGLSKTSQKMTIRVHRLVLMAFNVIKRPDQTDVDHISTDHLDNRLVNLRWVSKQEHGKNEKTRENIARGARKVKVKVIFLKNKKDVFAPENDFKIFESIDMVRKVLGVAGTTINRYAKEKKIHWDKNYYYEIYKKS